MHSRALGDGLVLRYFYDGCDNSVLRGFLPTHTKVQVTAYVDYNNAKQPVTPTVQRWCTHAMYKLTWCTVTLECLIERGLQGL